MRTPLSCYFTLVVLHASSLMQVSLAAMNMLALALAALASRYDAPRTEKERERAAGLTAQHRKTNQPLRQLARSSPSQPECAIRLIFPVECHCCDP
jgi:hypothetical protein